MQRCPILRLGLPCLFAVAVAAAAGGCGSDEQPGGEAGSSGAAGSDAGADNGGAGGGNAGGSAGSGGIDAGQTDTTTDVDWGAMCAATLPPGPGSCVWACGCQTCARVTAECLANYACAAIVDCTLQQGCSNDPDAGANSCQVKCAKVILDNYTAGGLRASAFSQCAAANCQLACLPDASAPDVTVTEDATTDAPLDAAKPDSPGDAATPDAPADVTAADTDANDATSDVRADVPTVDAPADAVTVDAAVEGSAADAPTEAGDAAETGTGDAASD